MQQTTHQKWPKKERKAKPKIGGGKKALSFKITSMLQDYHFTHWYQSHLRLGGHVSMWWGIDHVCMKRMERIGMDKHQEATSCQTMHNAYPHPLSWKSMEAPSLKGENKRLLEVNRDMGFKAVQYGPYVIFHGTNNGFFFFFF